MRDVELPQEESIMHQQTPEGLPKQKITPVTWMYVGFAVVVVALTIWGFASAGSP